MCSSHEEKVSLYSDSSLQWLDHLSSQDKKSLNSYGYENNSYDSTYLREEYPPEYSPVPFN